MIAAFTTFSLLLFTSIKNASCASVPSEAFLAFYEGLARKHLRESSFSLGPQWRENDGTFREIRMLQAVGDPVVQCPGTASTFDADGTAVSYIIALPSLSSPSICLWMSAKLPALDINYNAETKLVQTANQQVAVGVTCSSCYAHIGMDFSFSMACSTSACTFGFKTGGGIDITAALTIENPDFSVISKAANIVAPPTDAAKIPSASYKPLFNSAGLFLSYLPAMQVSAHGSGVASGSRMLSAKFKTSAAMQVGLNGEGNFVEGFSADVIVQPPAESNGLKITKALNLTMAVNATVYWSMGYSLSGVSSSINFMTPLITSYSFGVTPSSTGVTCTSGESLVLESSLTSLGMSAGGYISYAVPLTMPFPAATIYSSDQGTRCLGSPTSNSATGGGGGGTTGGGGGGGDSSGSDSSGISPGALAAAIVVPILFVIATGGFAYYWFYIRKVEISDKKVAPEVAPGN